MNISREEHAMPSSSLSRQFGSSVAVVDGVGDSGGDDVDAAKAVAACVVIVDILVVIVVVVVDGGCGDHDSGFN